MTQGMRTHYRGVCLRCGKVKQLTRDHVVPRVVLKRIGLTSPPCNTQPLCDTCNNRKGEACVDYRSPARRQELRLWLTEHGAGHIVVFVGSTQTPQQGEIQEPA